MYICICVFICLLIYVYMHNVYIYIYIYICTYRDIHMQDAFASAGDSARGCYVAVCYVNVHDILYIYIYVLFYDIV